MATSLVNHPGSDSATATATAPARPSRTDQASSDVGLGPHYVALAAAAFTWPLLFVGGLVTSYRVGMAVPDWPTTFGMNMFLYDFTQAAWGVFIEHGHRLYGAAVGVATIILAVWLAAADRRVWMKVLGGVALLAVIGQGLLGGYRVRMISTDLAMIHGCTGQAFFALMVALCVLTGRDWRDAEIRSADDGRLRLHSAVTLAALFGQIVAGAWLRHHGYWLGLATHFLLFLVVVLPLSVSLAARIELRRLRTPALVFPSRLLLGLMLVQVALGIAAWWLLRPFDGTPREVSGAQALIRTGHQANGALVLGAAVMLTMRAFRHLGSSSRSPAKHVSWDFQARSFARSLSPSHTSSSSRSSSTPGESVA